MPISKLFHVPRKLRCMLKVHGINTRARLLAAAGQHAQRRALAHALGVAEPELTDLVQQADLRRIKGLGMAFGWLLLDSGVRDTATLAAEDPAELRDRLYRHNRAERLTRRSPSLDEVADWIRQARSLPCLLSYGADIDDSRESGGDMKVLEVADERQAHLALVT